jgi:hypothetical protein
MKDIEIVGLKENTNTYPKDIASLKVDRVNQVGFQGALFEILHNSKIYYLKTIKKQHFEDISRIY